MLLADSRKRPGAVGRMACAVHRVRHLLFSHACKPDCSPMWEGVLSELIYLRNSSCLGLLSCLEDILQGSMFFFKN